MFILGIRIFLILFSKNFFEIKIIILSIDSLIDGKNKLRHQIHDIKNFNTY